MLDDAELALPERLDKVQGTPVPLPAPRLRPAREGEPQVIDVAAHAQPHAAQVLGDAVHDLLEREGCRTAAEGERDIDEVPPFPLEAGIELVLLSDMEVVVGRLEVDGEQPVVPADEMPHTRQRLHRELHLLEVLVQGPQVQAEAVAPAALERHGERADQFALIPPHLPHCPKMTVLLDRLRGPRPRRERLAAPLWHLGGQHRGQVLVLLEHHLLLHALLERPADAAPQ